MAKHLTILITGATGESTHLYSFLEHLLTDSQAISEELFSPVYSATRIGRNSELLQSSVTLQKLLGCKDLGWKQ
jgi:hypothetical protein